MNKQKYTESMSPPPPKWNLFFFANITLNIPFNTSQPKRDKVFSLFSKITFHKIVTFAVWARPSHWHSQRPSNNQELNLTNSASCQAKSFFKQQYVHHKFNPSFNKYLINFHIILSVHSFVRPLALFWPVPLSTSRETETKNKIQSKI